MPRATDRRLASIACVLAALHAARAWPALASTVDDAWISARYAMHLALGNGLTYNASEAPVEGYTNLLWVVQTAALWRVTGADPGAMHALLVVPGLIYGMIAVAAAVALVRALVGAPTWLALLPALWLALDPHLAVVATNGIESSQFLTGVLGCSAAVLGLADVPRARPLVALAAAALVAVRPEGIAVVGALAGWEALRTGRFALGPAGVGGLVGAALVWGGRLAYFGALVPNTFTAKDHRDLVAQISFNLRYLTPDARFWLAALALFVIAALPPWRSRRTTVLAIAAGLALVAFRVDFWMPGGRLLLPSVALAACAFADRLAEAHRAATWPALPARRIALAALAFGFGDALVRGGIASHVFRFDGRHTLQPGNGTEIAARHVARHVPDARIAVRDAGAFAFFAGPRATVLETHQRALTRTHPDGRDTDPATFVPDDVEIVVITIQRVDADAVNAPNDAAVAARFADYRFLGRVEQHHHRYYDLWARPDLALPPLPAEIVVPHVPAYQFTRDQPDEERTISNPGQ